MNIIIITKNGIMESPILLHSEHESLLRYVSEARKLGVDVDSILECNEDEVAEDKLGTYSDNSKIISDIENECLGMGYSIYWFDVEPEDEELTEEEE